MNHSLYRWSYKLNKIIPSILHLSICLLIWSLKSSWTRTKLSSCNQNWHLHRCKYNASQYIQVLFKDPDCVKIAPSTLQLGTYTNKKVKLLGSCNLYLIHPDTRCITEVTFFVASNEGSILISCAKSLDLGLIKPHDRLDHLPPEGNVIFSSADKLMDESWLKVPMLLRKPKLKSSNERLLFVFQWWTI